MSDETEANSAPARVSSDVQRTARRTLSQLGPARLAATAVILALAVLLARFGWEIPLVRDAESALYDLRSTTFADSVAQDERLVMIVYTDQTLTDTGQRSPVDRTILAQALANIDQMQPKGIAIDLLFDSPQDDDPLLQGQLKAMQTPTWMGFAELATNQEAITHEQEIFLRDYHKAVQTQQTKPTSIRLETGIDGVARRWPEQPTSLPLQLAVALALPEKAEAAKAFTKYTGPIRYRLPLSSERPVFNKLPIDLFADPEMAAALADQVKGRYVLIGGDIVDVDQFDTPITRIGDPVTGARQMIGLEVHAHMLVQLLDDYRPAPIPGWVLWVAAALVVLAGALTAMLNGRAWLIGTMMLVQIVFFAGMPFFLERANVNTLDLPSLSWGLGWLLAYASVGAAVRVVGAKQRQFAQGALGKYLPPSVAAEIMRDPDKLALHGEKREIFCVFTDLEGFTKLSHAIEPEMVAQLLNAYLDKLAGVVLQYGGTLDKFVGDAVVAFWGAPIAKPDDGERALRAAHAMYLAGEEFRLNPPPGVPPIGVTRVGMHFGEAIVGNFGGEGRIQYTAFGDSMNTAARLEAANKNLKSTVLVSREAMERTGLADWCRPLGRIVLRGRAKPVEIYEPVPDAPEGQKAWLAELIAAHDAGDMESVKRLTDKGADFVHDVAIANMLKRLSETQKGESYVLG